jgi:hypothetical protein
MEGDDKVGKMLTFRQYFSYFHADFQVIHILKEKAILALDYDDDDSSDEEEDEEIFDNRYGSRRPSGL